MNSLDSQGSIHQASVQALLKLVVFILQISDSEPQVVILIW